MSEHNQQRHPDEIEKDIHQSRERLDSTLHQIEDRFSPDQLLHTTYDYLRQGGANEFFSNLSTTIKQNPVPVLLTGAGLGWLMLRQSNPQAEKPSYATNVHATSEYSGQPAVAGQNGGEQDSGSRMQQAKESAQHIGHSAKGAAQHLGEKAQQMGGQMHDSVSHAQQGSHDRFDHMKERAHQASDYSSDFVQEHPMVVAALGFALGAALAGICPTTRKEDKYLGEYRDQVVEKAAEAGEEQVDKAQQAIHEKAESVKQQAEKQGSSQSTPTAGESTSSASSSSTGTSSTGTSNISASSAGASSESMPTGTATTPSTQAGLAGSSTPSGNTQGVGTNQSTRP